MISLEGKVALVTGASRGIGAAVAHSLAEQGVRLGLASRSGDDLGIEGALAAPCDVRHPDDLASLALRHWWEDYYRRRSEPDHKWSYTDFGDGNVSFPRPLLEQIGGWDEQFSKEAVRRQDGQRPPDPLAHWRNSGQRAGVVVDWPWNRSQHGHRGRV